MYQPLNRLEKKVKLNDKRKMADVIIIRHLLWNFIYPMPVQCKVVN